MIEIKENNYLDYENKQEDFMQYGASVSYNYGQKNINKYHDKTFKKLFSNKKEAVTFINKHLKLDGTQSKLKDFQLEKCNTEFITSNNKQLETDILFRIKGKKIFILIEQQSKVDFFMAKRILYYYVEIMREIEKEDLANNKKLPIIYPIVLYTGKTKWTAKTQLMDLQEEIKGISKSLSLYYNLIDINDFSKEELIKERSSISKALLMEKIKNKKELIQDLERIAKENLTSTEKQFIIDILTNIVTDEIGEKKARELKAKINNFKEEDSMVTENLRNIFRMNYNEGVQFATRNIIIQMLKNKMSEKTIKKITKIDDKELQKIKDEM